jgi:YD repeat-containing protein
VRRGNLTNDYYYTSATTAYEGRDISFHTTGQVIQSSDFTGGANPTGNLTSYSYSDVFYDDNGADPPATHTGAPKTNAYVTAITDTIGSRSMGYYYGSGNAAGSTDYSNLTTYSHYVDLSGTQDPFERPTKTDFPIGWVLNQYHLPVQGQTVVDSYSPIGYTGAATTSCTSCTHSRSTLDSLGRVITGSLVNNPSGQIYVNYVYDALNRISSATHPNFGSSDPNNVSEAQIYDGLGRSVGVVHPDGESSHLAYGAKVGSLGGATTQQSSSATYGYGYPMVSLDEAGKQRQEWIDGFGHVIEVDEPGSTGLNNSPLVTTYKYDTLGNLIAVSQGAQSRTWQYDGLSRLTKEVTPEAGTITLSYLSTSGSQCSGNPSSPCSRTAPAPNQTGTTTVTTTYSYDTANRLVKKS